MSAENPGGLIIIEKRISQWEELMKKFSEAHKEECKTVSVDIPRAPRSIKQFPTGSQYEGTWDVLGMSGYGHYTFPNGVIYEGEFDDGMFHGEGELRYPSGVILQGKWVKGTVVERKLIFADGLAYAEENWGYCRMPDRRFTVEYETGLQPAGESYKTADQPTREIPPGMYDTGEGFFDPKTKMIFKPDDLSHVLRSPSVLEQEWIIKNCRKSHAEPLGPRPELYEEWSKPELNPVPVPMPGRSSDSKSKVTMREPSQELKESEYRLDDGGESAVFDMSPATSVTSTKRCYKQPYITFQPYTDIEQYSSK